MKSEGHMEPHTLAEYNEAGCPLFPLKTNVLDRGVQRGILDHTGGKVCVTGCFDYKGGRCESYKLLTRNDPKPVAGPGPTRAGVTLPVKKEYAETVREQAARLNISLSEVRRLRSEEPKG